MRSWPVGSSVESKQKAVPFRRTALRIKKEKWNYFTMTGASVFSQASTKPLSVIR